MKAVILAGGLGTRLSEETGLRPKPMVEVGGIPILWHIMKIFEHGGVTEFIVCLGYKGDVIKSYFRDFALKSSDITIDLANSAIETHRAGAENWKVTLVDTGDGTSTGGRLKRVAEYLDEDKPFFMTYGDGLADIDLSALRQHHGALGASVTVSAVKPSARFGRLKLAGDWVDAFEEKPTDEEGYVNGGFFVIEPSVLEIIHNDDDSWEENCLPMLSNRGEVAAFKHESFWQPMDTLRDRHTLEELWSSGHAPWKVW